MPDHTDPAFTPIEVTDAEFASQNESNGGLCTVCRKFTGECCEPDAHDYKCPECGRFTVFGAEEALLQGFITITE